MLNSFACGRGSQNWFTQPLTWGVLSKLFETELETRNKDNIIFCAGPLKGGKADNGTRKVKENVEGLDTGRGYFADSGHYSRAPFRSSTLGPHSSG